MFQSTRQTHSSSKIHSRPKYHLNPELITARPNITVRLTALDVTDQTSQTFRRTTDADRDELSHCTPSISHHTRAARSLAETTRRAPAPARGRDWLPGDPAPPEPAPRRSDPPTRASTDLAEPRRTRPRHGGPNRPRRRRVGGDRVFRRRSARPPSVVPSEAVKWEEELVGFLPCGRSRRRRRGGRGRRRGGRRRRWRWPRGRQRRPLGGTASARRGEGGSAGGRAVQWLSPLCSSYCVIITRVLLLVLVFFFFLFVFLSSPGLFVLFLSFFYIY